MSIKKLKALDDSLAKLVRQRNAALTRVRKNCKHLRLLELEYRKSDMLMTTNPPRRICIDCAAEEEGWGCGYHVLVVSGDSHIDPLKEKRAVVERTRDSSKFYGHRRKWPAYFVGQSHPNFAGGGVKTYAQLTEIVAE